MEGEWLIRWKRVCSRWVGCRRLIPSRNARRGFEEQITGVSISCGITILESVDSKKCVWEFNLSLSRRTFLKGFDLVHIDVTCSSCDLCCLLFFPLCFQMDLNEMRCGMRYRDSARLNNRDIHHDEVTITALSKFLVL